MLRSLHIENIAVIRRADLELKDGFSVLTGETGAGKSMIIDSINLLLGNRVSKEMIRTGEKSATVSAVFENLPPFVLSALAEMGFSCEDGTLMLQRTLNADGRSQTRLDGQIITQSVQKEIARMLVSIHGQSDNHKLMQKSTHLGLIDAYARPDAELNAYRSAYSEWKTCRKKLDAVSHDESEKARLSEMLKYQIEDIDALKLCDGEEETLTRERDRLLNLERINKQVNLCYRALRGAEKGSAYDLLRRAGSALRSLDGLVEGCDSLYDRLETVALEVDDIAETVAGFADDDREDPTARIDRIETRLEGIAKLKRKYGGSIAEILAFRERAAQQLEELEFSDEERSRLEARAAQLLRAARERATVLTEARRRAAKEAEERVIESLAFLDMPKVRFEVRIAPAELGESGADDIEFLLATNPGEPLLPMIKIASGGELSRIMLALRSVLNDREGASTVIFDEVDTGVSGKTSRKVGMKLKETAKDTQVICVTHSAQIASLADTHYRIAKNERGGRAETEVYELDSEQRVEEVARILGGIEITAAQRSAAQEMIEEYR
ncbi:MAG: DNA repair protein RecN [Clostridia bacterium]|nr:DNA repair protein RecN [Clostridia bacterium]